MQHVVTSIAMIRKLPSGVVAVTLMAGSRTAAEVDELQQTIADIRTAPTTPLLIDVRQLTSFRQEGLNSWAIDPRFAQTSRIAFLGDQFNLPIMQRMMDVVPPTRCQMRLFTDSDQAFAWLLE